MSFSQPQLILESILDYMPAINSLAGLLLYFLFASIFSVCCMHLTSGLSADVDIEGAMKKTIKQQR